MQIIVGTYQGSLLFLYTDFSTIKPITSLQISQNSIKSICTTTNGHLIAGGYDQQLHVIDLQTHHQKVQAKQNIGQITKILQINQKLFVVGIQDGKIRLWSISNWNIIKQARFHKKAITGIVSRQDKLMVTAGGSKIILWNVKEFKKVYQYRFGQNVDIEHINLSQDMRWIYYCNSKGQICSIFTQNNQQKTLLQISAPRKIQDFIIFHNFLIISNDLSQIMAWQLPTTEQPIDKLDYEKRIWFKAHNSRIKQIKVVQDMFLLIVTAGGDVSLWDFPQFLDSVQHISQNYHLDGLTPICSTQVKGRILCVDTYKVQQKINQKKVEINKKSKISTKNQQQQQVNQQQPNQQIKKVKKNKKTKLIKKQKKPQIQQKPIQSVQSGSQNNPKKQKLKLKKKHKKQMKQLKQKK